jgi:multisubunit Na+/H+ antiporter MnhB subunit
MRELSYVAALIAGLVLLVAAAAWFRIQRNPGNDLTAGQGGKPDSNRLKTASWLISAAVGIAGLAALIAVISLVLRVLKIS